MKDRDDEHRSESVCETCGARIELRFDRKTGRGLITAPARCGMSECPALQDVVRRWNFKFDALREPEE